MLSESLRSCCRASDCKGQHSAQQRNFTAQPNWETPSQHQHNSNDLEVSRAQRILRACLTGQELLCDLWACVWGFCWTLCGAGSIRLAARVRPDLLALMFTFKMVPGKRFTSSRLLSALVGIVTCPRPQAGLEVGSLLNMLPSH